MLEQLKRYDLITVSLKEGVIKNCLVHSIQEDGMTIFPVQQFIEDSDYPRAIAKIFISKNRILNIKSESFKLLFFAINTQHRFTREAIEYHMNKDKNSR